MFQKAIFLSLANTKRTWTSANIIDKKRTTLTTGQKYLEKNRFTKYYRWIDKDKDGAAESEALWNSAYID